MNEAQELALARWMVRHHNVITAAQAAKLGVSPRMLHRLTASGRLIRRHSGVYVDAAGSATPSSAWLADADAALAALGPDAAISHRSAAWLLGLLAQPPERIEVLVPADHGRTRLTGIRLHRSQVPFASRPHLGLRVTDPARTVIDVAATAPARLDEVIERDLARRVLLPADLEVLAGSLQAVSYQGKAGRRRRGAATLRRHLDQRGDRRRPDPP
jgi:predicted transcriptional regulator of viral defense system